MSQRRKERFHHKISQRAARSIQDHPLLPRNQVYNEYHIRVENKGPQDVPRDPLVQ